MGSGAIGLGRVYIYRLRSVALSIGDALRIVVSGVYRAGAGKMIGTYGAFGMMPFSAVSPGASDAVFANVPRRRADCCVSGVARGL